MRWPNTAGLQLTGGSFTQYLIASYTSIKAALQPAKLIQGIGKGGRDVGRRFAVQPLGLD